MAQNDKLPIGVGLVIGMGLAIGIGGVLYAAAKAKEAPEYDARFDLNNDGVIDDYDVEIFQAHYEMLASSSPQAAACDFNGDGIVDIIDYSMLNAHYGAVREEVAPPAKGFYMPPKMEAVASGPDPEFLNYYNMLFQCPITNKGNNTETHTIKWWGSHPDAPTGSREITLAPGETYVWEHQQYAMILITYYLEGDWAENNRSIGVPELVFA
ncbi:hypothetical protein ES703_117263 [subsurface metagenome]